MDHYAVLGVDTTFKDVDLRRAWRKKVLQYHPDKNSDGEEMFKKVNSYVCLCMRAGGCLLTM